MCSLSHIRSYITYLMTEHERLQERKLASE